MRSFNRGNSHGFKRNFRNQDSFNQRREGRQMYKAVCSNCGKECEVPFNPTRSKPVYCNDCFHKIGGKERNSTRSRFNDRESQVNYVAQFEAINTKLDKILNLLRPASGSDASGDSRLISKSEEIVKKEETNSSKSKKGSKKGAEKKNN